MPIVSAKDIIVKPIAAKDANRLCKKWHYSGKVVPNSQLHFGVFLDGLCEGVMQFGPSTVKHKMLGLVKGTGWNEFIELNRMAFNDVLPRNSESRAIGIALRMIKKQSNIKWVISFADATQCGDGTIYRASGFALTGIKKNKGIIKLPNGEIAAAITYHKGANILKQKGRAGIPPGSEYLPGHQLRYIYFIDKSYRSKLTVPEIPYSRIQELGIGMYKGVKRVKHSGDAASYQLAEGGSIPTNVLQTKEATKCP